MSSGNSFILTSLIFLLTSGHAVADPDVSADDMKAIQETMQLLQNPQQRNNAIKEMGGGAKRADETLDAVSGGNSESKEEIYGLAAIIFQRIAAEAGGDPAKMQVLLREAMANPRKFAESLTPEEKSRLKEIAGTIESGKPAAPKH